VAGYEELASMASRRYDDASERDTSECDECGATTTRDRCRKCSLLDALA